MALVHNERTKLTATYLNGLAIAVFAVGALAPLVGFLTSNAGGATPVLTLLGASCVSASVFLHWRARRFLGRLRE